MCFKTTRPISQNLAETALLPGVIRSYVGRTVLIQDYVSITLNHSHTLEIPTDLKLMLGVINQIHVDLVNLSNTKSNQDRKVVEEILYTNTLCKTEIREALQWFPNIQNITRNKRGLFNIVGIGLKHLFGVLAQGDLDALDEKLTSLEELKNRDHKLIEGLATQSEKQRDKINEIISQINEAKAYTSNLTSRVDLHTELQYISMSINNIHKEVEKILDTVRKNIDDLSRAATGIVSTNIITLQELTLVLHEARIKYNLRSIFPPKSFAYYYTLIQIKIAPSLIILQIPMKSDLNFHHFKYIPFVTFHKNDTVILRNKNTDLLVQDNNNYIAETDSTSFEMCKRVAKIEICQSNLFVLNKELNYHSCLYQQMKTQDIFKGCVYEVVRPVETHKQIVKDRMYITLPRATNTRIDCGAKHNVVNEQTFSVDVSCNIVNENMTIFGSQSHEVVVNRNYTRLVRKYSDMNFAQMNLSFIKSIDNTDTENMIISQDTLKIILPTIPVLFLIFIVILAIVIYCRFCKQRKPKKLKKMDSEIESSNSDKDAAKWIANYIRNNPRMSMNPYLNPHATVSRRNINPVVEFDD